MATLGTIATTLTVNSAPASAGLAKFRGDVAQTAGAIGTQLPNSSRRGTFALLELSRGVEDAAVGFGTNGLQGAIRGSINNVATMATMISPLAGAIAGFAGAGLSLLVTGLTASGKAAKGAKDELAGYREELQRLQQEAEQRSKFRTEIAGVDSSEEARKAKESRRAELRDVLAAKDVVHKALVSIEDEQWKLRGVPGNEEEREKLRRKETLTRDLNDPLIRKEMQLREEIGKLEQRHRDVALRESNKRHQKELDDARAIAKERERAEVESRIKALQTLEESALPAPAFDERPLAERGGGGPVAALQRGTTAAFSAAIRASQQGGGVELKQLAELKNIANGVKALQKKEKVLVAKLPPK